MNSLHSIRAINHLLVLAIIENLSAIKIVRTRDGFQYETNSSNGVEIINGVSFSEVYQRLGKMIGGKRKNGFVCKTAGSQRYVKVVFRENMIELYFLTKN